MSIVCDAFHCTPDIAERQDLHKVMSILEYRVLADAARLHNEDATKMSEGQAALWIEMMNAVNS